MCVCESTRVSMHVHMTFYINTRVHALTHTTSGMADFQVLAPGLNKVCFKAETLDPSIFQITGTACAHIHVHVIERQAVRKEECTYMYLQ